MTAWPATRSMPTAGDADDVPAGDVDAAGAGGGAGEDPASVYGDNAYGTGEFHDRLGEAGIESMCKTQPSSAASGLFSQDAFDVDLGHSNQDHDAQSPRPHRRPALGSVAAARDKAAREHSTCSGSR